MFTDINRFNGNPHGGSVNRAWSISDWRWKSRVDRRGFWAKTHGPSAAGHSQAGHDHPPAAAGAGGVQGHGQGLADAVRV